MVAGLKREQVNVEIKKIMKRLINVLDEVGSWRLLHQRGRLGIKSHDAALTALEKHALQFESKRQSQDQ